MLKYFNFSELYMEYTVRKNIMTVEKLESFFLTEIHLFSPPKATKQISEFLLEN